MSPTKSNQGGRASIRAYLSAGLLSVGLAVSGVLVDNGRLILAWFVMASTFAVCAIIGGTESTDERDVNHE